MTAADDVGAERLTAACRDAGFPLRGDAMSLAELDGQLVAWRGDDVERPWLVTETARYLGAVIVADVVGARVDPDGAVRLADGHRVDVVAVAAERLARPNPDLRGVIRELHARPAPKRRWWRLGR